MHSRSMLGLTGSLALQKLTWIAQRRYAGQVEYFQIVNAIETQQLLYDVTRLLLYTYVNDTKYKLSRSLLVICFVETPH